MANWFTGLFKSAPEAPTALTQGQVQAANRESVGDGLPFGPGMPLEATNGYRLPPRQYDYRTGANVRSRADRDSRVSFDTLRGIIDAYDVAQMCITHRVDDVRSLDWTIVPKDGVNVEIPDIVDLAVEAMESPDGQNPFSSWLAMYLEDVLRYDAGALYRRRDRIGRVCALEVVDGTTIAPIIDYQGRRPTGDAAAYTQFVQGAPFIELTAKDLIYQPFRPQSNSTYGRPAMESVLLAANTDLRFQQHFLKFFTEGNIPAGFASAPDQSTPDQVIQLQEYWDAILQGDAGMKSQIRWVPNGTQFDWANDKDFDATFPEFLMGKVCAAFHVTPSDLGFTQDVNRATSEVQKDIQFRIGTLPLVQHVQGILTRYLQRDLGMPVKFQFDTGQDDEDALQSAQVDATMIDRGVISPDEVRERRYGLPVDNARPVPRYIMTTHAGPVPLVSVFGIAGPIDPDTSAPDEDAPLEVSAFTGADGLVPNKEPGGQQFHKAPLDPDDPLNPSLEKPVPGSGIVAQPGPPAADPLAKELRRWRDNARTRAERGQKQRPFESEHIPADVHAALTKALAPAVTRGDVDEVFEVVFPAPKARRVSKSWRDDPPVQAPQHAVDLAITDHYAPLIEAALLKLWTAADLAAAVVAAQNVAASRPVRKDEDGGDDEGAADEGGPETDGALALDDTTTAAMRAKVADVLGSKMSTADLESIVRQVWMDSYLAGGSAATQALTGAGLTITAGPGGAVGLVDLSSWVPGNPDAAALADNGGWQAALARSGDTIAGIADTQMSLIGTAIVNGLARGSSVDDVGDDISAVIGDPVRAEMIAHTETARMLTDSSLTTYGANGIEKWDWIISASACPICVAGEGGSPYPVMEGGLIPAHPRCRCAAAPHV